MAAELMRASKPVIAYTPPPARREKPQKHSKSYRVRVGDSLLGIARDHSCDLTVLAHSNHIRGPNYTIKLGQRLKLTGCEG